MPNSKKTTAKAALTRKNADLKSTVKAPAPQRKKPAATSVTSGKSVSKTARTATKTSGKATAPAGGSSASRTRRIAEIARAGAAKDKTKGRKSVRRNPGAGEIGSAQQPAAQPAAQARPSKTKRLSHKDLQTFRHELLAMRNRITGTIDALRQSSLTREDGIYHDEDLADAFDRLLSLERAGNNQEIIYKIDEALIAIEDGTYGVCESCGKLIQKPRLSALPFAKTCIECQSAQEGRRRRNAKVAPRRFVP